MLCIDVTYQSAYHNLALEEALLNACDKGLYESILRFWQPQNYFVVLGHGKKIQQEVNVERCGQKNIPILRRISGGGTVVNGPGCLNYALFLPINGSDRFENIIDSNRLIIEKNIAALCKIIPEGLSMRGSSDMVFNNLKFSGNAQKRKKNFLLFHGTFLLDFDLDLVSELLPLPIEQPEYRENRSHKDFITNLNVTGEEIKTSMMKIWKAEFGEINFPDEEIEQLVEEKYTKEEWTCKF